MISPADLDLPQADWRKFQLETAIKAVEAFGDPAIKFVGIEAPPGSGKSVLALAIARLLEANPSYIATGTKQLQAQYLGTAPGIVAVKGRGNFDCEIEPVKADDAPCTYGFKCPMAGRNGVSGCPYYDQKRVAWGAREVAFNYAYWLTEMNYISGPAKYTAGFRLPELVIADEAHTLDSQLLGFASIRLSRRAFAKAEVHVPRLNTIEEWREWAWTTLKSRHRWKMDPDVDGKDLAKATTSVLSTLKALTHCADRWIITPEAWGTLFRPVWVNDVAEKFLLSHGERFIFLSATMRPKERFCALLGINPAQMAFFQINSTFDPVRRPLVYWPAGKVSSRDTDSLNRLVERVDDILDAHPAERGLIHTVSYEVARHIMERSRHGGRVYSHASADRENAILDLANRPTGVLVSPSVSVGVDLPDDLCRFQIICKLPFPNLGDPQIKARMEFADGTKDPRGRSWYPWEAKNNLIQMYGRIMRSETDWGISYLLDANWRWFRSQNAAMIPSWVMDALVTWPDDIDLRYEVQKLRDRIAITEPNLLN